jgi:CheY-like chemotaxis protein
MTDAAPLVPLVLVVEDDPPMRRFLRTTLGAHGFRVLEAATAAEALASVTAQAPELVLMDLGLPDGDGIELTRTLRTWSRVPVIVLSARGREADKVEALDAGADDYLTKPFGVQELLARIRVALRHAQGVTAGSPVLEVGPLRIDVARREVTRDGEIVHLTTPPRGASGRSPSARWAWSTATSAPRRCTPSRSASPPSRRRGQRGQRAGHPVAGLLVARAGHRGEIHLVYHARRQPRRGRHDGPPGAHQPPDSGNSPKRSARVAVLVALGLFGTSLLYGDGMITPAISVLSAVEGLEVATPAVHRFVVPITLGILVGLFLMQKRGTAKVGAIFGPATLVWFVSIALAGLPWIVRRPEVLAALNPYHAAHFLAEQGRHGWACSARWCSASRAARPSTPTWATSAASPSASPGTPW